MRTISICKMYEQVQIQYIISNKIFKLLIYIKMENLEKSINNICRFPNKETMELFLVIWNTLKLFKTVNVNKKNWENELWYVNINAIVTISIVAEYLSDHKNSEEKERFLKMLYSWKKDEICKYLWNLALDIRSNNNPTQFWLSMIKSCRKRITQEHEVPEEYFPIIPDSQLPNRYINPDANHLIHEEFEAELARIKWTQEWAKKIQQETEKHKFDRWNDNEWEIKDLKGKL